MMTLRYWLLLSSVTAAGISIACSSPTHSCQETRTCPAAGGKGSGNDAGAAGEAEGAVGGRRSSGAGGRPGFDGNAEAGAGAGEGGEGGAPDAEPALFGPCAVKGAFACVEHASAQRLACDGERWQAGTTCPADQLCDSSGGKCATVVSECSSARPGAAVCRGDVPLTCGPDLVTASEGKPCEGRCDHGVCQAPTCGDEKVEAGEVCDNAADNASGACAKCKRATCGDNVLYAGHEQCDDGNTVSGDGCSSTCKAEPVELALGNSFTCVRSSTGLVKCWGYNGNGQLGAGDTNDRGDTPGTVPSKLSPVDLGAGRTAIAISARGDSACALLDNHDVKCWGSNSHGQLGTGDTADRGDSPGEMTRLQPIPLGDGRTAVAISSADTHTCAVLQGGGVKCWGWGVDGQLGQESADNVLSPANVPLIKLAHSAMAVSASNYLAAGHGGANSWVSCALLEDGTVQCWGTAAYVPRTASTNIDGSSGIGDNVGEMSGLPVLSFGKGRSAKSIVAGRTYAAILDDGSLRLWGDGDALALPAGTSLPVGMTPTDLAALSAVDTGGKKVTAIDGSLSYACAIFEDGALKCWGSAASGALGLGTTVSTSGVPKDLPSVDLGGHRALRVATGNSHTCAILDNGTVQCWGANGSGQLGLGDVDNRGNTDTKLSDNTTVDLTF